jgi:hypothetical protein
VTVVDLVNMHPEAVYSLDLSATSQQYFSLRTNQPPATSQQYFSLRTNQHQPSATSQTNRLLAYMIISFQSIISCPSFNVQAQPCVYDLKSPRSPGWGEI